MGNVKKNNEKFPDQPKKIKSIASASTLSKEQIKNLEEVKFPREASNKGRDERLAFLKKQNITPEYLTGEKTIQEATQYKGNIENFIGVAQIPVGLGGPMLVNGNSANGDYYIPLATTEGSLVASYSRGMKACRLSGGITSICLEEGVQRSPFFKFDSISTVGKFIEWAGNEKDTFSKIVKETSQYARLVECRSYIEGNSVIMTFEYTTGDAAGQNMVTICTDRICQYILKNFPYEPVEWYIESNYSGDKKATVVSFSHVRGKKVTSEVNLPRDIVTSLLHSTPEKIEQYWKSSTLAVTQSGAIGAQGHIANGLTALFIACGQDVACVSESSVGLTRMETNGNGDLYASLTLPSLIVGTVGGGTSLPTQNDCLQMLDCAGNGNAKKFAEICCALALSGEISIAAAMSSNQFTAAHEKFGRK